VSYPPSSPGGAAHPWAPRGPGDTGSTSSWAPPAGPPTTRTGPATGSWAPPGQPPAPGGAAAPWAPTSWGGGYPSGPPSTGGGGMPPHPPGYRTPAPPDRPGPGAGPTPTPAPSSPDRGGRLMSALVGGLVGAVVAALIAAGLVLATDDDPEVQATGATETTEAGSGSVGVGESLDIQQILDKARPSVVQISITVDGQSAQAGSGFVYDAADGLVLTNAHVIEGVDDVSVTFFDGQVAGAELVGSFPADDVAMLRVQGVDDLQEATLGSSDALRVGEDVVAIGNALGLAGEPTVTTGIVSALNREVETEDGGLLTGLIQTDAAINPGNSGGPLLNADGDVVGINTLKRIDASNIGFALAIDNLRPLIEDLREGNGEVTEDTPFLGVATAPVSGGGIAPEILEEYEITGGAGLIVSTVTPGSGADEAGVEPGDVILEADGTVTNSNGDLAEVIRAKAIGDVIALGVVRRGEDMTIEVTLGQR
jgi:putative serine protease PepD